ncbi:MAG TPA: primase-helicase family protein [Caulobacteraceae bacterium]|jgi:hypothetical protein|nr:primase-helicase family protein [Caulobacteraceae bacterium]
MSVPNLQETYGDARVIGHYDENAGVLARPFIVSFGSSRESTRWAPKEVPLGQFVALLCQHKEGKKDGLSFVLGDMVPGRRLKTAVKTLYGVGLDIDVGTPAHVIDSALESLGCLAVRYTTHSHLKTKTEFKKDRVLKWAESHAGGAEIDDDLLREFIAAEENWHATIVDSVSYDGDVHQPGGVMAVATHAPIPKHRIVVPFAEPYIISDEGKTQAEAMKRWGEVPRALAERLRLPLDKSCLDPSRLFYLPRHAKGKRFDITLVSGRLFDWRDLDLTNWAEINARVSGKAGGKSTTDSGRKLGRWSKRAAHLFLVRQAIDEHCPDHIRNETSQGVEILCPFDENHSNAGDPDDRACLAVDAGDGPSDFFTVTCRHESCRSRTNLDMLGKMLDDGWLPESVLEDAAYRPLTDDAEAHKAEGLAPSPDKAAKFEFDKEPELVEAINSKFAVVKVGASARVLHVADDGEIEFLTKEGAAMWLAPYRYLMDVGTAQKPGFKSVDGFSTWLKSPDRRQYDRVVFSPGRPTTANHYNLWRGFGVEARPGTWDLMRRHLFAVVCAGDFANYTWLLCWLSQLVSEPWDKRGTAVVLRGPKGTGKSTVGDWLARIFGAHAVPISSPRSLVGNFNAHFERAVIALVEEGFWAGDKASEGVLKHLVTAPLIQVERKGLDALTVDNFTRILVTSNQDWVVPATQDERRFLVLDVSDVHKQDTGYFAALRAEADSGGLEAMLWDLLHFDFEQVDLRNPPKTAGLAAQVAESFSREMRWWYSVLSDGAFPGHDGQTIADWPEPSRRADLDATISRSVVAESYAQSVGDVGGGRANQTNLGKLLRRVLPGREIEGPRVSAVDGRTRTYRLPPLEQARAAFEGLTGVCFDPSDACALRGGESRSLDAWVKGVRPFFAGLPFMSD